METLTASRPNDRKLFLGHLLRGAVIQPPRNALNATNLPFVKRFSSFGSTDFSLTVLPNLPVLRTRTNQPNRSGKSSHPPRLVILGPPAGGKGTQCELLVDLLGVVHLSTGNILRQAIQDKSPLGLQVQQFTDSGELVPDELIVDVVLDRLAQPDCKAHGWLLDGFPRTPGQAQALLSAHGGAATPDCILELEVPDAEVIRRIAGRRMDPQTGKTYHVEFNPPPAEIQDRVVQRSDDTEEKLRTRLTQFHAHSEAVREVFESCRGESGAIIQVMRANGYQPAPAIALKFADLALQHAAQRSVTVRHRERSRRLRRRIAAGSRGVYYVPDTQRKPVYPSRAHALWTAPVRDQLASGLRPQAQPAAPITPARRMLRGLLRMLH
ncbi:hypothetical protein BBJ28_00006965 [Nothophytophthora sp. Chile5]|nr:hypothetical protein BBJ28_00006965 [Nothophytophthora sp. Chile5]